MGFFYKFFFLVFVILPWWFYNKILVGFVFMKSVRVLNRTLNTINKYINVDYIFIFMFSFVKSFFKKFFKHVLYFFNYFFNIILDYIDKIKKSSFVKSFFFLILNISLIIFTAYLLLIKTNTIVVIHNFFFNGLFSVHNI